MNEQILLEVHYTIAQGKREEFYKKISEAGIADASRAEKGNLKYDYYMSFDSDDEICLIELWENSQAQQEHKNTVHFQKLSELKEMYVENTDITTYHLR